MAPRAVLVTGAAGKIGRLLAPALHGRYALRLTDARPLPEDPTVVRADLSEGEGLDELCRGVDTVVHLAASTDLTTSWEPILRNNIIGCHRLFAAAAEAGCRRVVYASSIHAVDGHRSPRPIPADAPPYPRTLYGASKVWGEALAAMLAQRTSTSFLCLRLGWVMADDDPLLQLDNERLDVILTHRDLVSLVAAAIEAPDDVRFGVFYGLSNNRRNRYDLEQTRRRLGYAPKDDAFAIAEKREPQGARSLVRAARRTARRILRGSARA